MALKQKIYFKGFEASDTYIKIKSYKASDYFEYKLIENERVIVKKYKVSIDCIRFKDSTKSIVLEEFSLEIKGLTPSDLLLAVLYASIKETLIGSTDC